MTTLAQTMAACERADREAGWHACHQQIRHGDSTWDATVHPPELVLARRALMPAAWHRGWADRNTQQLLTRTAVAFLAPEPQQIAATIQAKLRLAKLRVHPDAPADQIQAAEQLYAGMFPKETPTP
jgi:hypothetical protein